jgi:hypothetical protein
MAAPPLLSKMGHPIYHTPECVPDGLKHCPRCDGLKAPSEFYRDRKMPDGCFHICKHCARRASRERHRMQKQYNSLAKRLASIPPNRAPIVLPQNFEAP